MSERRIVEAREPFSVTLPDGTPLVVSRGDRYYSDDPLISGLKPLDQHRLFGELKVKSSVPAPVPVTAASVETATAGPDERRRVTRGRSSDGATGD